MPLELRQRLYPAVFEAFAQDDYERVGIREISRLSGVSSATIYKYFGSKEVLLTTVFGSLFPFLAEEMGKRVSSERPADENFRSMFEYLLDFYDRTPALPVTFFVAVPLRLWMRSGGWRAAEVEPIVQRILEAGHRRGEIDPALSVGAAMGLFYMHMQHEVQAWYLGGRRWRMARRVDRFFPLFQRAIAAPTGPRARARRPTPTRQETA
jgi:AcrR family transcriptional regulator